MTDITMPRLSDSMEEGTILSWLKAGGDVVARGDELAEIETDKATMTYESPAQGVLVIVATEGSTLPVGQTIARLTAADAPTATPETAPAPAAVSQPAAVTPRATPLARRTAAAHGVDLAALQGSGPGGRVTRQDVAAAAAIPVPEPGDAPPPAVAHPTAPPVVPPDAIAAKGATDVRQLSRLQQVVARRMAEAKATVPEFQVQTDACFDDLIALRERIKDHLGVPPSINDFVVKAAALALRGHPRANASYRDGHFELHERVNVGVAVAADEALVVPTVFDADTRPLAAIALETRRLAARVRSGEITPPELSGATFTVSNLGMFGMTAITPVINPPQAAILGVGAARSAPALVAGRLVERRHVTLSLTCDHRILYGADAAQFLSAVRGFLEQPLRLVL